MRKIIHVDMDCFYAAVEVRDNPALRGKPVAIGGSSLKRGVLSTCNYEARKYGLHSAMPTAQAVKLCPNLLLVPHHFDKYKEASYQIHKIFAEYSDTIEPLSLDEAYIDVSHHPSATLVAQEIRKKIWEQTKLTASAGVAPNKFLAKVASDWKKPNGIFVIPPEDIESFVKDLPLKAIPGVGKVTAKKLGELGFFKCSDLYPFSLGELTNMCGKLGGRLYNLTRGIDESPVQTEWTRKSLSLEHTYSKDLLNIGECVNQLPILLKELKHRLKKWLTKHPESEINKLFIKVKFNDFQISTSERMMPICFFEGLHTSEYDDDTFIQVISELLHESYQRGNKPVRLLGVGLRFSESCQLSLKLDEMRCLKIRDSISEHTSSL